MSAPVTRGARVRMRFSLALADGTPVEATGVDPFDIVIGDGQLVDGLERCLLGLHAGERGHFELEPLDEFGPPGDPLLQRLPRSEFASPPQPGAVIGFEGPAGDEVPGTIVEVTDEEVVVDFAHPLAGHPLVFDVEIIEVGPPRAESGSDRSGP